jgi:hypothetical protein
MAKQPKTVLEEQLVNSSKKWVVDAKNDYYKI